MTERGPVGHEFSKATLQHVTKQDHAEYCYNTNYYLKTDYKENFNKNMHTHTHKADISFVFYA